MNKTLRLLAAGVLVLTLALLSVGANAWASPAQQGTVPPPPPPTIVGAGGGTVTTATGTVAVPAAAIPSGGQAAVTSSDALGCEAVTGPAPQGQQFLSDCIPITVTNANGAHVLFLSGSVRPCFVIPPGTSRSLVRRWYSAAELQALGRVTFTGQWVAYPSFTTGGMRCATGTRIDGTFALFGS